MNKFVALGMMGMICLLLMPWAEAQEEVTPPVQEVEVTLPPFERFFLGLAEEFDDELYPNPYFAISHLANRAEVHGDIVFDSREWKEAEDDALDDMLDSLRHTAVREISYSSWYQSTVESAQKAFGVEVDTYLDRPRGVTTAKRVTLDARIPILELKRDGTKDRFDGGVRWRNLGNPGIFVSYEQLRANGNGSKPKHELIWQPMREEIIYSLRNLPSNWDMRLEYDYDDDEIRARLLDAPRWLQFNEEVRGHLMAYHNFRNDSSGVQVGFAIRW